MVHPVDELVDRAGVVRSWVGRAVRIHIRVEAFDTLLDNGGCQRRPYQGRQSGCSKREKTSFCQYQFPERIIWVMDSLLTTWMAVLVW